MSDNDNTTFLKIQSAIDDKRKEMSGFLEELVNQDSYTRQKEDVDRLGQKLVSWLQEHRFDTHVIQQQEYGNQIVASIKGDMPGKIVIMMHMDTVFPRGTAKQRPFSHDERRMYGPGVADMKSGIVSALYASWLVNSLFKSRHCDLELILTSDEEIASPCSRPIIEERLKTAHAVFNMEPARADGSVVTARRGSAQLKVKIEGKAAHSGIAIEQGINAISEICQKFIALEDIMDKDNDLTVNLGTIQGGVSTNMVAPFAEGTIHFGFWKNEDFDHMFAKAKEIVEFSHVKGTKAEISLISKCLPMVKNDGNAKMYEIVSKAAVSAGIPLTEQATRGAADAGIPSSLGIPTICGMGPVGANLHSEEEYVETESFYERTSLLALSILFASERIGNHTL